MGRLARSPPAASVCLCGPAHSTGHGPPGPAAHAPSHPRGRTTHCPDHPGCSPPPPPAGRRPPHGVKALDGGEAARGGSPCRSGWWGSGRTVGFREAQGPGGVVGLQPSWTSLSEPEGHLPRLAMTSRGRWGDGTPGPRELGTRAPPTSPSVARTEPPASASEHQPLLASPSHPPRHSPGPAAPAPPPPDGCCCC